MCQPNNTITEYEYICELECSGLYYYPSNYNLGKDIVDNDYYFNVDFICEQDDCNVCGKRILYGVTGSGYQIQNITLPRTYSQFIHNNMNEFIDKYLTKCTDYNVRNDIISHTYKTAYRIYDLDLNEIEDKKFDIMLIKTMRNKKLKFTKYKLLNHKLKNE
jgi:hypothetical protein